jgi:hypothetical protein
MTLVLSELKYLKKCRNIKEYEILTLSRGQIDERKKDLDLKEKLGAVNIEENGE